MYIAILGTNHGYQLYGREGAVDFQLFLADLLRTGEYDAIAEELSEESVAKWKASDSTARLVASSFGVQHHFCDPTTAERSAMGIPSSEELRESLKLRTVLTHEQRALLDAEERKYWPAREAFWLRRLKSLGARRTLFILGSDHVRSFSSLLDCEAVSYICLHERWGP